ncbi:ribonuclease Y-like isoform X2 [Mya arenaria]|uniref:ribonuclease Y-like isoform X2 n=1 Tax=Mya arenaria TaxID=6604 RepID=UPI0022E07F9B|nr:ribonuclease Y-like isoform X2 [Mya arenaria]
MHDSEMDETEEEGQKYTEEFIRHTIERETQSIEALKRDTTQLSERIRSQEEEIRTAREQETKLKEKIEKLEKECTELKNSSDDALATKERELKETKQELKEKMTYKERVLMEYKEQYRIKDEALRTSGEESSQLNTELMEELRLQVQRYQRLTKTVSEKGDEIDRLKMRLSEKEEELKRKKTMDTNCFLYSWLFLDCHVSLQTPAGTYISVYPPGIKGFNPTQLNVVQSLQEDCKRLGHPDHIIPLFGLNVDDIDDWYKLIDVDHERWTADNSMLETALTTGSDDLGKYLEEYKHTNTKSADNIYSAAWYYSLGK